MSVSGTYSYLRSEPRRLSIFVAIAAAVIVGYFTSHAIVPAILIAAIVLCMVASRYVETMMLAAVWAMPYMVVNLPTGSFTLKLCDGSAYLFAGATVASALLSKKRLKLPPASVQLFVYLGVLAISAACEPTVAHPYIGAILPSDRNSPNYRSASMIIWEVLSWFVVVAFYNVIGDKPGLLRKAICAHIRSAAVASIIGLVLYVLAFCGVHVHSFSNTETRSLAPESNWGFFRLAGVAYEPLFFGFYLGVSIPVTLAVRQFRPNWMPKWQVAGSLLVQSAAMFLTFSAGGWASLLISLTVFTYWTRDRNRRFTAREKGRIAAVVAISAIVMAGLILTIQPLADKIQGTVEKVTGGGDNVRKGEWAVGWGIAQDYPFLGCGPGMANYLFPKYHPTMLSQSMAPGVNEVNNVYLGTLAESGIVGLVALCWCALTGLWVLVAALRRYGYRNAPILAALTASLLGCAIQYMSIGPTTLILIYFVDVAGLALAATRPSPALAAPTSSSIEI